MKAKKHIERITSPNGNITVWAQKARQQCDFGKYAKMLISTGQLENVAEQLFAKGLAELDKQKDEE